jgi:AhpD family alkylhydroperoxidase
MPDYHYDKDTKAQRDYLRSLKKDYLEAYGAFNNKVFEEGAISKKNKELIAIACAHITHCPYCIDGHTKRAKEMGVTEEEIAEAIFVATAMAAGASMAHSNIAMKALMNTPKA